MSTTPTDFLPARPQRLAKTGCKRLTVQKEICCTSVLAVLLQTDRARKAERRRGTRLFQRMRCKRAVLASGVVPRKRLFGRTFVLAWKETAT